MRKKCTVLSIWSFALALGIFVFSYILYHYITPDGFFTAVFQTAPGKPLVTLLFCIWGVMFLFAGVMSLLVGHIFFKEK